MTIKNHSAKILILFGIVIVLPLAQQPSAIAHPPSNSLKKVSVLLDRDQDKSALECLNSLIVKEPRNANALCERSRLHARSKTYDKALDDCNRAIRINPRLGKAYAYRAAINLDQSHFQQALTDSNKAISLEPGLSVAYSIRAQVHQAIGQHNKAIADCNQALVSEPRNSKCYLTRAVSYRALKQYQKSIKDCDMALSIDSNKALPHIERGLTYLCLGKTQSALNEYTDAIRIRPDHPLAYVLRSVIFGMFGRYEKQIADLTTAINVSPRNERIFELRASAYYETGFLNKAIQDCVKATTLNPLSVKGYLIAAKCHEELGLYGKAIEFRSKLLSIEKQNPAFWSDRARDYYKLGQFTLAQADWQLARQLAKPSEFSEIQLDNPLVDLTGALSGSKRKPQPSKELVVMPIDLFDCNHIGVPCTVNGRSLNLMLDTGCAHTQLWETENSVPVEDKISPLLSSRGTGEKFSYAFFVAKSLKLGVLAFSDVPMTLDTGVQNHQTLSGFLGGNILENFAVTVDYKNKKLIVNDSLMEDKTEQRIVVPMTLRDHCPYCMVKLNGIVEVSALLDTGSSNSLLPDALAEKFIKQKLCFKNQITGPWLGKLAAQRVSIKTLTIGTCNIRTPSFDVYRSRDAPSAASEIVLGSNILQQFSSVTLDYPRRRVIFNFPLSQKGFYELKHEKSPHSGKALNSAEKR